MILEYIPFYFDQSTNNLVLTTEYKNLLARETFWITKLKPSYNLAPTAYGTLNYKHTDLTKKNMSEANYNAKNSMSDETRLRMSIASINRYKTDALKSYIISNANSKPVV